jgi:hypothetical protein
MYIHICVYRHKHSWEEFMEHAVDMGSDAVTHMPRFIKTGTSIHNFIRGIRIQTHTDSKVIS